MITHENGLFHLRNENLSFLFRVTRYGLLELLHFGAPVEDGDAEALACRGGGTAVSPLARELSARRGPDELLHAIGQLDKCMEYAQGNVSPAAICGYLVWAL